jgi:hypothetical protein
MPNSAAEAFARLAATGAPADTEVRLGTACVLRAGIAWL